MPFPDALKGNPKIIFFTDFDGTITQQDTNDTLTDNLGMGAAERRRQNVECLHGRLSFRQLFTNMMTPIRTPFADCVAYVLARVQLDGRFADFLAWAEGAHVPVVILSSGLTPIIRAVLERDLGVERAARIEIVANHLVQDKSEQHDGWAGTATGSNSDGSSTEAAAADWGFRFRDGSDFGHDKSRAIRPYAEAVGKADKPVDGGRTALLYAGDGVSDLSAARETDLLFAKQGRDLVTYCEREGLPFTVFADWGTILDKTRALYDGKSVEKMADEGLKEAQQQTAGQ